MDTPSRTTPAPEKKARKTRSDAGKPKFEYFISKDGIPCRLQHFPSLMKKPIYVPCKPGEALHVLGTGSSSQRRAKRLVSRCEKVRAQFLQAVKNPLFTISSVMQEAVSLLSAGTYALEKRKPAIASAGTTG